MCKNQTSVSRSSTEPEIMWFDAGLRMDGLPALDLWDVVIEVSRSSKSTELPTQEQQETAREITHPNPNKRETEMLINCHMWTTSPQTQILLKASRSCTSLKTYETVIRMIIKGRSPTMRHASRTHRVALDWLFDRINLDTKIQIKYIDTKNQLADILTKGNFTRDEWNHLLTLFNISHFSSTACTAAMAKRAQQESGEERVTAKSRLMMNLTARTPSFVSSSASSNPGRTSYGYQVPGKSVPSDDRTGKPVEPSRPDYSKEDYGRSWSSQEWKSGAAEHQKPTRRRIDHR